MYKCEVVRKFVQINAGTSFLIYYLGTGSHELAEGVEHLCFWELNW